MTICIFFMKYMTSNEIRNIWLNFFKSKGHHVEEGASLVPHNDPTLLWINAGVAALKKYFDGSEKPKCNRITNAQKSIRTNDIENVGKTARHHTFFEMLGNWSLGDYFKKEAISWSFEFLTKSLNVPVEKLAVSVFEGNEVVPADEESIEIYFLVYLGRLPGNCLAVSGGNRRRYSTDCCVSK